MTSIKYQSCFHVEPVAPNMVFLFSEKEQRLLRGKLHLLLAPLLKIGKYTKDQMVDLLHGKASPAEVYYTLERLEKIGLIETKEGDYSRAFTAICQLLGTTPLQAEKKLNQCSVFVQTIGAVKNTALLRALQELGVRVTRKKRSATLCLILADDYLNVNLAPLLKDLFPKKASILLAKPVGCELWAGPLFVPQETSCPDCLATRIKLNRIEENYVQKKKGDRTHLPTSIAGLASTESLAASWLSTEIFKILVSPEQSKLKGKILSFNYTRSLMAEHMLIKRVHCSICGVKSSVKTLPPELQLRSRKKGIYDENGWRAVAPEVTLKKHGHHVSSILGMVKFLEPYQRKEGSSLYLYTAGHNFALSNSLRGVFQPGFRSSSGGKGRTDTQAKASALCEAIERYSGLFQGDEKRIRGTYFQMREKGAIHPDSIFQFSRKQYHERLIYNKSSMKLHDVPRPISKDEAIDWTPIWSLTEKRYKYIPTAFCYYGYSQRRQKPFYFADSNGNAAGNCLEEAILQGFFELVERDAVALWWYNRLKREEIDLKSFSDPYIPQMVDEYKEMNREVWVLNLTTDLNIPVFVALSRKTNGPHEEIYMGFGAHFEPQIALLRALTEMNQFLSMGCIWANEEESAKEKSDVISVWFKTATVKNQPYLRGKKTLTSREFTRPVTHDLLDDIRLCQKIVEENGMELLVLDQTRRDIDLNVVKVVVPGLRHFWSRFAPGRLFDVPVKMGWQDAPTQERDLNPIPMFL
ncbi:MAG: TOMM precursor leader peptide-binding protein [Chlamydiales bacterium]